MTGTVALDPGLAAGSTLVFHQLRSLGPPPPPPAGYPSCGKWHTVYQDDQKHHEMSLPIFSHSSHFTYSSNYILELTLLADWYRATWEIYKGPEARASGI